MVIVKEYPSKSSDKIHRATYDTVTGAVKCSCRVGRPPIPCWHMKAIVEETNGPGVDAPARAMAEAKAAVRATAGGFVKPMLAAQMDKADVRRWSDWAIEEKFDGHRVIVMVSAGAVEAWSRSGKTRELPARVAAAMRALPNGIYDGELMGAEGGTFADVRRLGRDGDKHLVLFDCLNFMGDDVRGRTYLERRRILVAALSPFGMIMDKRVRVAESRALVSCEDARAFVEEVWARGGEGAILKRVAAPYQAGRRSPDFVKVKRGAAPVAIVTGFRAGTRGPRAVIEVRLRDENIATTVKWESKLGEPSDAWIGRELRIECTEIRDGAVVNPRADRWENE